MIKFGESSLAVIVPKKWIDRNGLGASSIITISEDNRGNLVMSANERKSKEVEEVANPNLSVHSLSRIIGLHYMFGTTKLRLYFSKGYAKSILAAIEETVKDECPGFEVISHSSNDIAIEDFNNIKDADIWKIISRLHLLIKQEFGELKEGDKDSLAASERQVNRFYMLGIRYINMLDIGDSTKYFVIIQTLELISDNLNALSLAKKDAKILEMLEEQFDSCFNGLNGKTEEIEKAVALRDGIYRNATKLDALSLKTVHDIANGIARIAEFGLYVDRKE